MGYVFFALIAIGLIMWAINNNEKQKEIEQNRQAVASLGMQANVFLDKVNTGKTTKSRIDNCDRALSVLDQARYYEGYINVLPTYNELVEKIEAIKLILPVMDHLKKAHKSRFKGSEKTEKNNLLDALYEIDTNAINDDDFETAEACDDETGEMVTIDMILSRLRELGWEGEFAHTNKKRDDDWHSRNTI